MQTYEAKPIRIPAGTPPIIAKLMRKGLSQEAIGKLLERAMDEHDKAQMGMNRQQRRRYAATHNLWHETFEASCERIERRLEALAREH